MPRSQKTKKSASLSSRVALSPQEVQNQLVKQGHLQQATLPTLQALGILTPKGGASPNANRKIKQVNHFLTLLEETLSRLFDRYENPVIVDMGAGKGAIALAIYDRWIRPLGRGEMIGVESRSALVEKVQSATQEHYPRFTMLASSILEAHLPERIHLTLALHACDQATDHALVQGLRSKSDYFALVPCCQAEIAQLLKPLKSEAQAKKSQASQNVQACTLGMMWKDPWHRREFGAHLTNILRVLTLRSKGYQVTVTELTGWEHSLKNECILAKRVAQFDKTAQHELQTLLDSIPISPWLIQNVPSTDSKSSVSERSESTGEDVHQDMQTQTDPTLSKM